MNPNDFFNLKTLVFVPHYDDEVIGLGGFVAQLKKKDQLYFHFMTDGSKSPSPPFGLSASDQEMLRNTRRNESIDALKYLGIDRQNLFFSELPENNLKYDKITLIKEIKKLFQNLEPRIILFPFRFDRHKDHICLSRTVIDVVRESNYEVEAFEYFVYHKWKMLPKSDIRKYIFPEMLLEFDINKVSDIKKQAFSFFKSQTTLYFAWQTRPILTEEFITKNISENEVLLKSNLELKNMDIFIGSKLWILIVHALEYKLKKYKEDILSLIKLVVRFRFFKPR